MQIAPIFELTLIGVADPNLPTRERVVFRPTQAVDLTEFAVIIAWRADNGSLIPLWDHFYWFGNASVAPPSWICLYTGSGQYSETTVDATGERVHNFYWNRPKTIFSTDRFVPVLIRIGGLVAGSLLHPPAPRLAEPTTPQAPGRLSTSER